MTPLTRRVLDPVRGALTTALVLLLALVIGTAPASAHGGDMTVDVASDGAAGIGLVAVWDADGHSVGPEVTFTLSAERTTADGVVETVGPLVVPPVNEGQGFRALPDVLLPGEWSVTVVASGPAATEGAKGATVEATVAVPESAAPRPTTGDEPQQQAEAVAAERDAPPVTADAGTDPGAATDPARTGWSAGTQALLAAGLVIAAVLAIVVTALVRRRTDRHRPDREGVPA